MKPTMTEAAIKLTAEIASDAKLRENYKENIAMAFFNECRKNQVDDDLPLQLLGRIATKAAENFLNDWCNPER